MWRSKVKSEDAINLNTFDIVSEVYLEARRTFTTIFALYWTGFHNGMVFMTVYCKQFIKMVLKSIRHSLDNNGTFDEHSNTTNSCLNEIEFHGNHPVKYHTRKISL